MSEGEMIRASQDKLLSELGFKTLVPRKGSSPHEWPTSLDLTTKRGKALLIACGNPSDIEFDKQGIAVVNAVDWLIMPDEGINPETGEVSEFARTCLVTAEGEVFRTTAAHAPKRLAAALQLFERSDWKKGIRFLVQKREGKRGFVYHDIRLHPDYLDEE